MQNLLNDLAELLKKDSRFVDGKGVLLKNLVIEAALQPDADLLKLLLESNTARGHFFTDVSGAPVFDKVKFHEFVSNKEFLPDSYTAFKNRLGLGDDKSFLKDSKDIVLSWAYKDGVLEGGMTKEDKGRKEPFHNTTLAPDDITRLTDKKVFTNFEFWDAAAVKAKKSKKVKNIDQSGNLLIKGNNLLALHCLKHRYAGKVKLIYIDPPYNTGGDTDSFSYNNTFPHSSWLTFMKNRLDVSKQLLRDDGFIAITIDHVELFYLGALADEIFGADNRVGIVTIYINPKGRQHERFFSAATEYMLVYAKNSNISKFNKVTLDKEKADQFEHKDEAGNYRLDNFARIRESTRRTEKPNFWYPLYVSPDLEEIDVEARDGWEAVYPVSNGKEYSWKTKRDTFIERNKNSQFVAKRDNDELKIFNKFYEQQVLKNIWTDKKYFPEFQGTNVLKKLLGDTKFSYPKSLYAVLDTLKIMTSGDDIVLDFFAGSGTTAHALLQLNKDDGGNRKFILVEQMDYIKDLPEARVKAVIEQEKLDESFIYCELMEWNERYVQEIRKAKTTATLTKICNRLKKEQFVRYDVDMSAYEEDDFKKLSFADQQKALLDCIEMNHLYVNESEIDNATYNVSEEDKILTRKFYSEKG